MLGQQIPILYLLKLGVPPAMDKEIKNPSHVIPTVEIRLNTVLYNRISETQLADVVSNFSFNTLRLGSFNIEAKDWFGFMHKHSDIERLSLYQSAQLIDWIKTVDTALTFAHKNIALNVQLLHELVKMCHANLMALNGQFGMTEEIKQGFDINVEAIWQLVNSCYLHLESNHNTSAAVQEFITSAMPLLAHNHKLVWLCGNYILVQQGVAPLWLDDVKAGDYHTAITACLNGNNALLHTLIAQCYNRELMRSNNSNVLNETLSETWIDNIIDEITHYDSAVNDNFTVAKVKEIIAQHFTPMAVLAFDKTEKLSSLYLDKKASIVAVFGDVSTKVDITNTQDIEIYAQQGVEENTGSLTFESKLNVNKLIKNTLRSDVLQVSFEFKSKGYSVSVNGVQTERLYSQTYEKSTSEMLVLLALKQIITGIKSDL